MIIIIITITFHYEEIMREFSKFLVMFRDIMKASVFYFDPLVNFRFSCLNSSSEDTVGSIGQ